MKFVLSYSCGKDSTLALHKMLEQGHEPVGLLVMVNQEAGRSWFHGVDPELLEEISRSLGIPLIPCLSTGEEYHLVMEEGLRRAKELGAQAAVFGDIDIEEHAQWCRGRCEAAGLKGVFPLWQRDRKENAREILALGKNLVGNVLHVIADQHSYSGNCLNSQIAAYFMLQFFCLNGIGRFLFYINASYVTHKKLLSLSGLSALVF